MDYKIFHNCLRIQITNDSLQDERIQNIVKHCKSSGFDNVMLCINQEEFNVGHIPLEMAKPWVAVIEKAAAALRENGICVSINNWIEIGHADRGRHWFEGQDFQPFVDMNGKVAENIACPMCEKWFEYFSGYASYIVKTIKPDTFWIEDDFRLHNHAPLFGIGCYCEKHMAYYNEKLGTNYTREEFLKKAFAPGPLNAERKVWLEANRDVMVALADKLAKAIKKANPTTDVALMTSRPAMHLIEARDWNALLGAFSQGGTKINRIHLPYGEIPGKEFLYEFNSMSMPIRAFSPKDTVIMPEIEHGSATSYCKTARYLGFTLESSLPLILSGCTYSIYGFHANGARDSFGFGKTVKDLLPYMQAVRDMDIDFSNLSGVTIPIDEKGCFAKEIKRDYTDLTATEFCVGGYLGGLGIGFNYSQQKSFENKTLFLTASNADYFSNDQLCDIFAKNRVICDASFAVALSRRGLLHLINANSVSPLDYDVGEYSYEECEDESTVICGVRKLRASARARCLPPCYNINYGNGITALTSLYDHFMKKAAVGIAKGKNFIVLPFSIDKNDYAMYDDLRRHFISEFVKQGCDYCISENVGISSYMYKDNEKCVVMLTNGNVDCYEKTSIITDTEIKSVKQLGKDGKLYTCDFENTNGGIVINSNLDYLSCNVYILNG